MLVTAVLSAPAAEPGSGPAYDFPPLIEAPAPLAVGIRAAAPQLLATQISAPSITTARNRTVLPAAVYRLPTQRTVNSPVAITAPSVADARNQTGLPASVYRLPTQRDNVPATITSPSMRRPTKTVQLSSPIFSAVSSNTSFVRHGSRVVKVEQTTNQTVPINDWMAESIPLTTIPVGGIPSVDLSVATITATDPEVIVAEAVLFGQQFYHPTMLSWDATLATAPTTFKRISRCPFLHY